VANDLPNF
jgi:hypothetical protein